MELRNKIFCGDALSILRMFDAESVHACVTSPPYWGLRSYGGTPLVWGGDGVCAHEWGEWGPGHHPVQIEQTKWKNANGAGAGQTAGSGQWCEKCGAWRGHLGLELSVELYVLHLTEIFREVRRVLRNDGSLYLNLGDGYANDGKWGGETGGKQDYLNEADRQTCGREKRSTGLKPKDLLGVPWAVAFALRSDGWYLRSANIWAKGVSGQVELESEIFDAGVRVGIEKERIVKLLSELDLYSGSAKPESVRDRPTLAHEYVFQFTKSERYYYDPIAGRERGSSDSHGGGRFNQWIAGAQGGNNNPGLHCAEPAGGAGRNRRSVWLFNRKHEASGHYATYPEALAGMVIEIATSEKGCCAACGAPWKRVVERGAIDRAAQRECGADASGGYCGVSGRGYETAGAENPGLLKARILDGMRARVTKEWARTCEHVGAAVEPCLVLDPFLGSGTTAVAAWRRGRAYVGIELNAEYVASAEKRIVKARIGCAMFEEEESTKEHEWDTKEEERQPQITQISADEEGEEANV